MLDLNLNFINEEDTTSFKDIEESGTSNSSIVNADTCNSSNAGDDDSISCFNFDILKVGGDDNNNINNNSTSTMSQSMTQSEFVTRSLFPVSSGVDERVRVNQINSLLLCPDTNELQEMRVVQVQPQKHNVQVQVQVQQPTNPVGKKSRRGPRSRSSQYRGVTFYRRTGRWESHIWDCGKQVYLGGFDTAHAAARAYDRAAVKFRGVEADINFSLSDYEEDMKQMPNFSKEEFVHILRRQSTGFSRGSSKYRGVTLHKCGRWEARMGQFLGKKAYDKAAIECNGREAVTNFDASSYEGNNGPATHHVNDHNLNLSLGISTDSLGAGSSKNVNVEQAQFNQTRKLQLENPVSNRVGMTALKGLPISSGQPSSWNGVYPAFVPNYEGSATNSRAVTMASQGPPYWGWQVHGLNHIPAAAAASSGFSAPPATSGSHYSRDTISMAPLNIHYPPPPTAATSSTQYYYQLRPPPPPP